MSRLGALLLLLVATFPLSAQLADDFALLLHWESGVSRKPLHARIENWLEVMAPHGRDYVLELDIPGTDIEIVNKKCVGTNQVRCTLTGGDSVVFYATMNAPGTFAVNARLVDVTDANPSNNQLTWTLHVVDAPSLKIRASSSRFDPGTEGVVWVDVDNYGGRPATDVVITLQLPDGGTFLPQDGMLACDAAGATMICRAPLLDNANIALVAGVKMPDRLDGGELQVIATVTSSHPEDVDPADNHATTTITLIRHLVVTNTNDEGAGSLRQALLDAQQLCTTKLCKIDFQIPGSERVVIQPQSELPEVQGLVMIDGATQTKFGGDTNPDGPEVVLDGSRAGGARGLLLGGPSCEMYVLDLAVQNFGGPGIEARRGLYDFRNCPWMLFPNTLIARNHIRENYRGITLVGAGYVTIADNVIDANHRAGIFTDRPSQIEIYRNRITGNGASGIFLNLAHPYDYQAAVVEENVISGNAEWGVARTSSSDARIRRNSIFGNRYLAIDAGLDLETPNVPDDDFRADGVPNKPVLVSAHYDAATGKTRIRGRLDSETVSGLASFVIDVYASRTLSGAGLAEAERWLAFVEFPYDKGHSDFEIEVVGDLRGQYLTATNTRMHLINWDDHVFDTSEISSAIQVP